MNLTEQIFGFVFVGLFIVSAKAVFDTKNSPLYRACGLWLLFTSVMVIIALLIRWGWPAIGA